MPTNTAAKLVTRRSTHTSKPCVICAHAQVRAVNNVLRAGRSVRWIQRNLGTRQIKRHHISRHRDECLEMQP